MNDIFVFGTKLNVVNAIKYFLITCFDMKELDEIDVILDIKITTTEVDISVNQSYYIQKILKIFGQFGYTLVCTPYDPNIHFKNNKDDTMPKNKYVKMVI